jgi:hypothetical protein
MATVRTGRFTADHDGELVVFVIGMRVNKLWKVHTWAPVVAAMGGMLKQLTQHPEKGMLGYEFFFRGRTTMQIMYWRSFEDLERFARNSDDPHLPAWRAFNRRVGTGGDVGIYHETYQVAAGAKECIYNNMPDFGLAKAAGAVPAAARGQAASYRIGRATADEPAEPVPTRAVPTGPPDGRKPGLRNTGCQVRRRTADTSVDRKLSTEESSWTQRAPGAGSV